LREAEPAPRAATAVR